LPDAANDGIRTDANESGVDANESGVDANESGVDSNECHAA